MPATQQDDDAMRLLRIDVLSAIQEFRTELIESRKMTMRALGSVATEIATVADKVDDQADDIKALQTTERNCQDKLGALSVEVAAMKADGAARAILMKWLLTFGMLNAIGAVIVAALLIYMVLRLFSLSI